jgi:hypothetical protein
MSAFARASNNFEFDPNATPVPQTRKSILLLAAEVAADPDNWLLSFNYTDASEVQTSGRRLRVARIENNRVYGTDLYRDSEPRSFEIGRMRNVTVVPAKEPLPVVRVGDLLYSQAGLFTFTPSGNLFDLIYGHIHPDNLTNRVVGDNRIADHVLTYWFEAQIKNKQLVLAPARRVATALRNAKV